MLHNVDDDDNIKDAEDVDKLDDMVDMDDKTNTFRATVIYSDYIVDFHGSENRGNTCVGDELSK